MTYLMGIDVGTTGAKTLIISESGDVAAKAMAEYPLCTPHPNWSEQDPEDWWSATVQSIQAALARANVSPRKIKGMGLTGQMHGLVLLDADGRALRPAMLWNDQRSENECREITERIGISRLMELVCNPALPGFTAPKILWVRKHEPQVYEKVAHILLPKDYIRYRLTGEFSTDVSDASGMLLLDIRRRAWSDEMLRALQIPREWLPTSSESTTVTGGVTAHAAQATGLHTGLPVVGGGGDQAAQAVGSGIVANGLVSATIGTSGVVFAHTDELRVEPQGRLHAFCHAVPGKWHVMGVMLSAGGSLRWFRDVLGQLEKTVADLTGRDPYEFLMEEAGRAPPGSKGLVFLPYLSGERTPHPDPNARGAFIGLTLHHNKADMVRAVLEGVAFGLRDSLELLKELGQDVRQVRISGGGARSALWQQILADILGAELATVNVTEGAAYGAALLAGVGAGVWPNVEEACQYTIRITSHIEPIPEHNACYEEQYALYRSLYPVLKSTFQRISQMNASGLVGFAGEQR
ncbi:MAG: xylulokinase [Chloroflexi bacterium]|nr:xylulokinase [Chloroflexota bacterium]